jgi:hypothetical protein
VNNSTTAVAAAPSAVAYAGFVVTCSQCFAHSALRR